MLDAFLPDGRLDVTGNNGTSAVAMNAAVGADGLREGGPDRGWCRTRGIEKPLPSSAETIAAFLPPKRAEE